MLIQGSNMDDDESLVKVGSASLPTITGLQRVRPLTGLVGQAYCAGYLMEKRPAWVADASIAHMAYVAGKRNARIDLRQKLQHELRQNSNYAN